MAKTETSRSGIFDVTKVFGDFRLPPVDVDAVVTAYLKNVEALSQANQLAAESMQALARRQTEVVQEAIDEASALVRSWTQPVAPEERLVNTVQAAKQAFERGFAHACELNELATKASTDLFGVIAKRVSESFDEVRLSATRDAVSA
jgi:phasin family protein